MAQKRAVRGTYLGLSCTQPTPLPLCAEDTLPDSTGAATLNLSFSILWAQVRAVRGTHLDPPCTQLLHHLRGGYRGTAIPNYLGHRSVLCSRTSSARDAFRSLLHSTHTSTSLNGGHATKLYGCVLPTFLILCAQERAVCGTHLGLLHSTAHLYHSARRPRYQTVRGPTTLMKIPGRNIWRRKGDGRTST